MAWRRSNGWCGFGSESVMRYLFQTNNPVDISFATALLRGEDIEPFVFDVNSSIMEGSIGILPRRVMVADKDYENAREILVNNGLMNGND